VAVSYFWVPAGREMEPLAKSNVEWFPKKRKKEELWRNI
jgi:hypothetical protein